MFYFILLATVHNFADDNALACIGKTILGLIRSLESECEVALNFFNEDKMIVNPGKFQAIITNKRKQDHANEISKIGSKEIKVTSQVKLLGVEIDDKLNFGQHINCICKSPANQLNALIRLKRFLGFQDKKVLVNSFVLSNFNYCTLVWMFANSKSLTKIENLHKRALRFMLDDYSSSYKKILAKSGKFSMDVKRKYKLRIERHKTLNNLNPSFLKKIFELILCSRPVREQYKLNLDIPRKKQVAFGTKCLERLGPKNWNNTFYHIKSAKYFNVFKDLNKNGSVPSVAAMYVPYRYLSTIFFYR